MPGPLEKQAVAADFRMALRLCHGRGIRTLASCLCVSKRRDHPTNVPKVRDRGITPETEVVTYCTIGNRASQAWFALKYLLGYRDVRVYYGSWAEWGTVADTPIETDRALHDH